MLNVISNSQGMHVFVPWGFKRNLTTLGTVTLHVTQHPPAGHFSLGQTTLGSIPFPRFLLQKPQGALCFPQTFSLEGIPQGSLQGNLFPRVFHHSLGFLALGMPLNSSSDYLRPKNKLAFVCELDICIPTFTYKSKFNLGQM